MAEFKPKNILVTGGAGFIGCMYVRYMLATYADVQIINLDLLTYAGSLENLKGLPDELRHRFVQGDICDRELIDRLLREYEIDTIVHFAAESHVDNSISGPEIFVQTNVMGTFTLLEAARKYWLTEGGPSHQVNHYRTMGAPSFAPLGDKLSGEWRSQRISSGGQITSHKSQVTSHDAPASFRFHHISTDEVYGTLSKDDPAFTEATPYAPNSPYSASKAGSDHLVRAYFHTYGLPVTTSNCSNNYGPYQHSEKLIPTIIRHCIHGSPIPVYGDGSNIRDWLYVEDHCSGIDTVIRRGTPGETYNIGGINEWANIDIVKCICSLMDELHPSPLTSHKVNVKDREGALGYSSLITFVTDRPGHDWRYAIDASRMGQALNWQPAETFETGIRKTVAWYLEHRM